MAIHNVTLYDSTIEALEAVSAGRYLYRIDSQVISVTKNGRFASLLRKRDGLYEWRQMEQFTT